MKCLQPPLVSTMIQKQLQLVTKATGLVRSPDFFPARVNALWAFTWDDVFSTPIKYSLRIVIQATFQAVECSCPYAMTSILDGVTISSGQCICSMSAYSKQHVTGRATCRTTRQCNFSSDTTEYTYLTTGEDWKLGTQTLTCPDDYLMLQCYYTSAWSQSVDYSKLPVSNNGAIVTVVDDSYCTVTSDIRFSLSAVCQNKWTAAVCVGIDVYLDCRPLLKIIFNFGVGNEQECSFWACSSLLRPYL
eukprot:sb/3468872/